MAHPHPIRSLDADVSDDGDAGAKSVAMDTGGLADDNNPVDERGDDTDGPDEE